MKNKYSLVLTLVFLALLVTVGLGLVQSQTAINDLQLVLESSKDTFVLGEPILLTAEMQNLSGNDLLLTNTFDPVYGSLKIYSRADHESTYREYMNPKWGVLESTGFTEIRANGSLRNDFNVLTRLEGDNVAKFFFPSAGTYYIKVSYQVRLSGKEKTAVIESAPIKIKIVEPVGEDWEVWNKIKDNGEIAYFIQEGDIHIPIYKTEGREKLKEEIEQIVDQYPNSFYADSLRGSLAKFQAAEQQRKKAMEKLKKPAN